MDRPIFFMNHWLTKARLKRVLLSLQHEFIGKKYCSCAKELTDYAYAHPDWQRTFSIWVTVNHFNIDDLEIREV
jgi:hypothetical protein